MLRFALTMVFAPETFAEACGVMRALVGPVRAEPGCRSTRLFRGHEDGHDLTWVEEWRDGSDFENHLRSNSFRRILAVIELAASAPAVEIDEVVSRRGFDLVEEILSPPEVGGARLQNR